MGDTRFRTTPLIPSGVRMARKPLTTAAAESAIPRAFTTRMTGAASACASWKIPPTAWTGRRNSPSRLNDIALRRMLEKQAPHKPFAGKVQIQVRAGRADDFAVEHGINVIRAAFEGRDIQPWFLSACRMAHTTVVLPQPLPVPAIRILSARRARPRRAQSGRPNPYRYSAAQWPPTGQIPGCGIPAWSAPLPGLRPCPSSRGCG